MKKILIADDDHDFVRLLSEELERAGYETLTAYEGIRVIELAHHKKPDLILLDWQMPAGKGPSVLENLSAGDDTRHIPVIVVTGVSEQKMEETAKSFGVRALIRKPYDSQRLLQEIERVLS